jgi:soluble lytic murein transglycosylase-like protein
MGSKWAILGLLIPVGTFGGDHMTIDQFAKRVRPSLSQAMAKEYATLIYQFSTTYGLTPALVAAVIAVESGFNEAAVGSKGEVGLMQLRPKFHGRYYSSILARAAYLRVSLHSISEGCRYLAAIKEVFEPIYGDTRYLEHYNQGPSKHLKRFPYTKKVMAYYRQLGVTHD